MTCALRQKDQVFNYMIIPERSPGRRDIDINEATYALSLRTLTHLKYVLLKQTENLGV